MTTAEHHFEPDESAPARCSLCGRPLTRFGQNQECLRCLASVAIAVEDEETRPPTTRLTPRTLKYAQFQVEMAADGFPFELGAGAMAVTYRAYDTILNSPVALKVIDRVAAKDPGMRSRFLREARAAAQIRHPNVAHVIHYGEQNGECFYAMELVDGETLEALVRRDGPVPLDRALEIIEQAARALVAAEACGVVHRDIKPSNIMLESDASGAPIVKVIDYGVAKLLTPEADPGVEQTHTGFIGTPAFASPEQFGTPDQTRIDTRSDIYSLGLTFWYLLSGRTPFIGETLRDIRERQAKELPWEQLKGVRIPGQCFALLKSMLAQEANYRPQTSRELLSAIQRCHAKFSEEARLRRRHFALAAAGLVLVLGAIALGTWLNQRAQFAEQADRSIAVLPFENHSPNGEDAYFTLGMQDEITGDLAKLAGMKVIGSQSTRSYLPGKPRDYRTISRDLGVRHLLEGAVGRENDRLKVTMNLIDVRDGAHPWTEAYNRPIQDVFTLQSEITRAVAGQLRERLSPTEKSVLDTPPTTDLRAYDLYLQAREMVSPTEDDFFANSKRAIPMLEEAITRDPNFVLAYCELARRHDELYFLRAAAPSNEISLDHRRLSEAALEKARRLQPDSGAVHLALARHALQINNNVNEAEVQIQLARQSLPNNAEVEEISGRIARRQDRWDDSIRCLERAVSLEPRDVFFLHTLADTYRYTRRYHECDRILESELALTPPKKYGSLLITRACARFEYSADPAPLREVVTAEIAADHLDEQVKINAEMIAAFFSHDPEAISSILSTRKSAFEWSGVSLPDVWFDGLVARMRGDNPAALNSFALARPKLEAQISDNANPSLPLSIVAIVDAGLGRTEQAVQEGKRACELSKTNKLVVPTVRGNLAVVYAWIGQNDLAVAELSNLIDGPAGANAVYVGTYGDFRMNPLWDPLRSDPRFDALVQRLAPTASK